jgi:hypothetical protein
VVRHVSVELLADHPQHLETLARWHCEEDCDGPPLEFWRRQLRAECGRDRIPIAFVRGASTPTTVSFDAASSPDAIASRLLLGAHARST